MSLPKPAGCGYPKWVALVNGLPWTETRGPNPGGFILADTQMGLSFVDLVPAPLAGRIREEEHV